MWGHALLLLGDTILLLGDTTWGSWDAHTHTIPCVDSTQRPCGRVARGKVWRHGVLLLHAQSRYPALWEEKVSEFWVVFFAAYKLVCGYALITVINGHFYDVRVNTQQSSPTTTEQGPGVPRDNRGHQGSPQG